MEPPRWHPQECPQKFVINHEAVFVRETNYAAQLKKSFGLQGVKGAVRRRRPLLKFGMSFHDMQNDETEIRQQCKFENMPRDRLPRESFVLDAQQLLCFSLIRQTQPAPA
ncbi:MAG: hypothetical protein AB7L09_08320 [Nitrospira sp.]